MKKVKIVLDEWDSTCGDGCCDTYGTTIYVDGVELDSSEQRSSVILEKVLEYLGYDVKVEETYNGQ